MYRLKSSLMSWMIKFVTSVKAFTVVDAMPLTSVATSIVSVTIASTAGPPSTLHQAPRTTAASSRRTVIDLVL